MSLKQRSAGILCPIFSLPNKEGVGTLGKEAYKFVDFLVESKQKYWQILPLGVTSYGDSPYQSFSSYAGNPYFVDLNVLIEEGLLDAEDIALDWGHKEYVDYEKLWNFKLPLLRKAFKNSNFTEQDAKDVCKQYFWLEDYATFMALKAHYGGKSRLEWDEAKLKDTLSESIKTQLTDEMLFHMFVQKKFYEQWSKLKTYANENGISIIGDLPIFVSNDSVDVWANSEIFYLDEQGQSTVVAGVPPDYFSETGQLWGNPLYNWDVMKENNFAWWIQRIQTSLSLFDVVRIDHFRGFESYWSVPFGEETAQNGTWVKAYGKELFAKLSMLYKGELPIIAEDLGIITDAVRDLIKDTGFPNMSILQFAFDEHQDNPYKPQNIKEDTVVYTGTHDNDTSIGWFCDPQNSTAVGSLVCEYLNEDYISPEQFIPKFIELAWSTKANIAIIPIQDLLGLGTEARINTPSTLGCNWKWRLSSIPTQHAEWLKNITEKYFR